MPVSLEDRTFLILFSTTTSGNRCPTSCFTREKTFAAYLSPPEYRIYILTRFCCMVICFSKVIGGANRNGCIAVIRTGDRCMGV